MKKLHPNQQKLLDILVRTRGNTPTYRELQEELGAKSPSVVQHHLAQLEKLGYLRRNPNSPQDFELLLQKPDEQVGLLNVYSAAYCGRIDSIFDCEVIDQMCLSTKLLGFPSSQAFVVKAKGNSMLPKIHDKDLVIARSTEYADSGELVVCVNEGLMMIKRLNRDPKGNVILQSLNPEYEPFIASNEEFRILGVVKSIYTHRIEV
jgi:repressor LexA